MTNKIKDEILDVLKNIVAIEDEEYEKFLDRIEKL